MRKLFNKVGFTLIELLITIAIIAILVSISYPSYRHYIVKTRRSRAAVVLSDAAASMEKYYNEEQTYEGATLEKLGINADDEFYRVQIAVATSDDFLLKAEPLGVQERDDTKCGALLLDNLGNRGVSGTDPVKNCWD